MTVIGWLIFVKTHEGQTQIVVCPSKLVYHIPCPGCGLTRATIHFFQGNIYNAFNYNLNVLFSSLFVLVTPFMYAFDILFKKEFLYMLWIKIKEMLEKPMPLILLILVELIVWINNFMKGI
jgi:hypothetical protein